MKNWLKENWFKIFALAILVGAFFDHPYAYYQILRWVVSIAGAYSAYTYFNSKNNFWGWIFVAVAVLFNPVAPIYLHNWHQFDLIASIIFLVSIFKSKNWSNKQALPITILTVVIILVSLIYAIQASEQKSNEKKYQANPFNTSYLQ